MQKKRIICNKTTMILATLYVAVLIASNISGAKIIDFNLFDFKIVFSAALFFFPLTYVLGDILTEVYGIRTSRFVVLLTLVINIIFVIFIYISIVLPPAEIWHGQIAYSYTLGASARIFIASVSAFAVGEMMNIFVLQKLKIIFKGKWMPFRFITSTFMGVVLGSLIFYTIAFAGEYNVFIIIEMAVVELLMKVSYDAVMLPISCSVARKLKKIHKYDELF
ncbi:MAG TPA: queuosine precursor transporter [Victivallales bacterium]|nr:queuosine precursor transporter [Victivallales bacterium]